MIGADGANSRVAKDIEAGDYEYAIAFQECAFFFGGGVGGMREYYVLNDYSVWGQILSMVWFRTF